MLIDRIQLRSFLRGEIGILSTLCGQLSSNHGTIVQLVALLSAFTQFLDSPIALVPMPDKTEIETLSSADEKLFKSLRSISKAPLLDRQDVRIAMKEIIARFDELAMKGQHQIYSRLLTFFLRRD